MKEDDGGVVVVVARMICFVVEFVKRARTEVCRYLAMLMRFVDGEAMMTSDTVDSLPLVFECRESSDAVTHRKLSDASTL